MILKNKKEFERLRAKGAQIKSSDRHEVALEFFEDADTLARQYNDRRKRLDTLNPIAQLLWTLGKYDKAKQKLTLAAKIAGELGLRDEMAFVLSNFGRFEAVKIIKQTPVSKQPKELKKKSLHYFVKSQRMLNGHEHLYYRYVNAKYGALVAALAQDYKKASLLLADGYEVALKKPRRYNQETPYKISPSGLEYFAAAAQLINLGVKNPLSREYKACEKLARELVK